MDLSVTSGAILVQQPHNCGGLDDPVGRTEHVRRAARQTVRNWIVLSEVCDAFQEDRFRPWPKDGFILEVLYEVKTVRVCFGLPQAGEVRFAVECSRCGSSQVRFTIGRPRNPRRPPFEPLS